MADWADHLGNSDSLFVNASTLGLMLTGKLIDVDDETSRDIGSYLKRLAARIGEPVIRRAVVEAIKILAEQFVVGRTINEALRRAQRGAGHVEFDRVLSQQVLSCSVCLPH